MLVQIFYSKCSVGREINRKSLLQNTYGLLLLDVVGGNILKKCCSENFFNLLFNFFNLDEHIALHAF